MGYREETSYKKWVQRLRPVFGRSNSSWFMKVWPKALRKLPAEERNIATNILLVLATLLTAITTSYFMCSQQKLMRDQVEQAKTQNELFSRVSSQSTRPFLLITVEYGGKLLLGFWSGDKALQAMRNPGTNNDGTVIGLDLSNPPRMVINTDSLLITFKNVGKLPLFLQGIANNALTEREWIDSMQKSETSVCEYANRNSLVMPFQTDYVLLPDSSRSYSPISAGRTISGMFLTSAVNTNAYLHIYPYVYVEYGDPYGRKYDALLMLVHTMEVACVKGDTPGTYHIGWNFVSSAVEKQRWDLLLRGEVSKI